MASKKLDRNTSIDVGGIRFETLISERHIFGNSGVTFGIRITNQTSIPQQFLLFWLQPIFLKKNVEWEQVPYLGANVDGIALPTIQDCQVVNPESSTDFVMEGKFIQENNSPRFIYPDKGREYHTWEPFQPGDYALQCKYTTLKLQRYLERFAKYNDLSVCGLEKSWVGEVVTPVAKFRLTWGN